MSQFLDPLFFVVIYFSLWLQGERFDRSRGPSISDLVAKEAVDKLTYMGWELDQAANPQKVHIYVRT